LGREGLATLQDPELTWEQRPTDFDGIGSRVGWANGCIVCPRGLWHNRWASKKTLAHPTKKTGKADESIPPNEHLSMWRNTR